MPVKQIAPSGLAGLVAAIYREAEENRRQFEEEKIQNRMRSAQAREEAIRRFEQFQRDWCQDWLRVNSPSKSSEGQGR